MLSIGKIVGSFGLRGECKLRSTSDQPEHLVTHARTLFLGRDLRVYPVQRMYIHKPEVLIIALEGVRTVEEADALRGLEVFVRETDSAPLGEGEYFLHQLYDLRVTTVDGEDLGTVREVIATGANDVLVVRNARGVEILIPIIRDVVQQLDIASGQIVVRLLEGLRGE